MIIAIAKLIILLLLIIIIIIIIIILILMLIVLIMPTLLRRIMESRAITKLIWGADSPPSSILQCLSKANSQ